MTAPPHYRTETAPDGSIPRVVGVWIDPAIATTNVAAGVDTAMSNWNNARDANGADLPYRFERVTNQSPPTG